MQPPVVIVTGAAGFIGSAITVDLARDHRVVALDRRAPGDALLRAAPGVDWRQTDIAVADATAAAFEDARQRHGRVDCVLHFAAFYHFGRDARPEYERTNVQGTAQVLRASRSVGASRLVFASSIAAMEPPPPGRLLDHRCPASDYLPYARSKAIGERMVLEGSDRLPSTVLRIGAAFSDWCELPPLHSLIVNWWGRSALRRVMVGCGDTGMPYVHLDDLVQLVRCCVGSVAGRADCEVFMAAQHGAVCHREMFEIVRGAWRAAHPSTPAAERPIRVSPGLAGIGLRLKRVLGALVGDPPFEQPWMLRYVDRPWAVDTSHTEARLDWRCTPGMGVCDRLPVMLDHLLRDPQGWVRRNRARQAGYYEFSAGLG